MKLPALFFRIGPMAIALGLLFTASRPATAADPSPLPAPTDPSADPVADLEAQYQSVLAILRHPPTSGVLVTEVEPQSAAAAGGVRAGDIISTYFSEKITSLANLRQTVADVMADRIQSNTRNRVTMRVQRDGRETFLALERAPLGIRAVEIIAGVPGARNPPPNLRGTLKLDWKQALEALQPDEGTVFLRMEEPGNGDVSSPTAITQTWLGWEKYTVTQEDFTNDVAGALSAQLEVHEIEDSDTGRTDNPLTYEFHLRLGDYSTTPAFLLDSFVARFPSTDGRRIYAAAERTGDLFKTQLLPLPLEMKEAPDKRAGEHHQYTLPLTAIVQPAVPLPAAAMPHDGDSVLALHLLSVRDFLPRPGYVLATRGKQPLPESGGRAAAQIEPAATNVSRLPAPPPVRDSAWRVDLMHCGIIIESYWFSDDRRLLSIQTQAVVISHRVASEHAAIETVSSPAATQPQKLSDSGGIN